MNRFFPGEIKLVHLLPLFFVLAHLIWFSTIVWSPELFKIGGAVLVGFYLAIFLDSLLKNKSAAVAILSIVTSFIQLFAYGMGLIAER